MDNKEDKIKFSLLIPTYNAGVRWEEFLKSVDEQTIAPDKKIIVDSGSTDDTVILSKEYGFEVVQIPQSEFNHGGTRQKLVEISGDVDICVFLTQDAILASIDSLKNIVDVFFVDSAIGMAYGRQLPHKNAASLEKHARYYNYPNRSQVVSVIDMERLGFKIFFCSDSFSAYKRQALINVGGFSMDCIMGEDAIVAAKMLQNGYKKAYVANALVYHSHSYSLIDEFKRYFDTRVFHEQNKWMILGFGKPTGEGLRFVKSELRYIIKNDPLKIMKSISSIFAKWLGYRSGKYYKNLSVSTLMKVSMHKHYWK